jgi:hypothetical protein
MHALVDLHATEICAGGNNSIQSPRLISSVRDLRHPLLDVFIYLCVLDASHGKAAGRQYLLAK